MKFKSKKTKCLVPVGKCVESENGFIFDLEILGRSYETHVTYQFDEQTVGG